MTNWTNNEAGDLLHCERVAYWADCGCGDEMCSKAVCSKCQEELLEDDPEGVTR